MILLHWSEWNRRPDYFCSFGSSDEYAKYYGRIGSHWEVFAVLRFCSVQNSC